MIRTMVVSARLGPSGPSIWTFSAWAAAICCSRVSCARTGELRTAVRVKTERANGVSRSMVTSAIVQSNLPPHQLADESAPSNVSRRRAYATSSTSTGKRRPAFAA